MDGGEKSEGRREVMIGREGIHEVDQCRLNDVEPWNAYFR